MKDSIVVAGSLAQRPGHGGHAWVFLQYLLGFRKLGWEVHFVDRLEPGMCHDARGEPTSLEASENVRYLGGVMSGFGLEDDWTLLYDGGRQAVGRDRAELLARVRRSAMLLNVMGYVDDPEVLDTAPLRVFLDIDPGFGQIWSELGLDDPFHGHDRFVTVGANIGRAGCSVPTRGLDWVPIRPPVELSEWPSRTDPGARFTSVASWRGPFGPLEFQGRRLGLRVHEFRRFLELPERTDADFELALDIDEADIRDLERLERHGWQLVDPVSVAADPVSYRDYVQDSSAELMIAKNLYVETGGGWFSDRSACYLASGRPVVAQQTGLRELPTDCGLVAFSTPEEAADAVDTVIGDYRRHSRAARAVAEEHFAADRVLRALLVDLGIG